MASIKLAYNNTKTIPAVGAQRITINVPFADDTKIERAFDEVELLDKRIIQDVLGVHYILEISIDPATLNSNKSFLTAFFKAPHTWAVFGAFKDPANSANDNLCKCVIQETEIQLSTEAALTDGYRLISEKVY